MLYWVERIASHVRVASMIIGQKDSSVCFVLNQEPNMIVQQPLFFSTTHRDNGTRLCWVREVSTAIIIIKKRDNAMQWNQVQVRGSLETMQQRLSL